MRPVRLEPTGPRSRVKHSTQGFRFFSRSVGQSDPWSKKCWVIFWNDGPKHIKLTTVDIWVVYFTYTLTQTQTLVCIYVYDCWLYNKTCLKWPLKKEDQFSLNAGQKYCRMLGSILQSFLTFIKLLFVIKIFVLSFLSGCLWHVLLPTCTFCFVEFVDSLLDEYFY